MPSSSPLHRPPGSPPPGQARAIDDGFYSCAPWRRVRALKLAESPLCEDPFRRHPGAFVLATDVDHRIPRRERPDLALAKDNLQPLCHACHSAKTRRGA